MSTTGARLFGRAQTRNAGGDLDSAIPGFHSRIVGGNLFLIGEIPFLISAKRRMFAICLLSIFRSGDVVRCVKQNHLILDTEPRITACIIAIRYNW